MNSTIDHVALIGACYLVAILAAQLMLYLKGGDWIGAALPLFSKPTGMSGVADSGGFILNGGIGSYRVTEVNVLVSAGAFLLVLLTAKLALGSVARGFTPSPAAVRATPRSAH